MNLKLLLPLVILSIFCYRLELYSQENLIYNGNFSLGNVGFTTDYIYSTGSPFGHGYYTIGTNPQIVHRGFAPCKDHTQDSAQLMMLFDSYTIPNKLVWSQEVDVAKSSIYQFSMWATKLVFYDDSYLQVKINGEPFSPTFHVSKASCTWSYHEVEWNSGNSTTALIEIYNLSIFEAGNDLAIDDIEFIFLSYGCITELNLGDDISLCLGDTVLLGNENGKRSELDFIWEPNLYIDAPNSGNPKCFAKTDMTYFVKVINLSDGCISYDTINVFVHKPEVLEILSNSKILCDFPITLSSKSGFSNHTWSTGDTSDRIIIDKPGIYTLTAYDKNGCLSVAEIYIAGGIVDFQMPEILDLGVVCLGTEILGAVKLSNLSNSTIRISDISYIVDNSDFILDFKHLIGKEIQPMEDDYFNLYVEPTTVGRHHIILRIYIDYPCIKSYDLTIKIEANKPIIYMSVPDTSVTIGHQICLPIIGYLSCSGTGFTISYKLSIRINKTLFNPLYTSSGSILSITELDNDNLIEIEDFGIWLNDTPTIVNYLCGLVMLGDKLSDAIYLTDMYSYNDFNYTLKHGSINSNLCAFLIRHIQMFQKSKMIIKENPVHDNLDIVVSSSERGHFRLEIFDILGNLVFVKTWQNEENIFKEFFMQIAVFSFNQGLYQVVLRTPWNTIAEKLIILK